MIYFCSVGCILANDFIDLAESKLYYLLVGNFSIDLKEFLLEIDSITFFGNA